jgi:hypothetical protein
MKTKTRLSIEIEDIADKKACAVAIRQLFTAFIDRHGILEANKLWAQINYEDQERKRSPLQVLQDELWECSTFRSFDTRIVLKYFAMQKPSKKGLAKELALRNPF